PDQPVEDNFQHRQALVGDHRRVDDRPNAGIVIERDVGNAEAEKAVDLLLREDALGTALARIEGRSFVNGCGPLLGSNLLTLAYGSAVGSFGIGGLAIKAKAPFSRQGILVDLLFAVRHLWESFQFQVSGRLNAATTARQFL